MVGRAHIQARARIVCLREGMTSGMEEGSIQVSAVAVAVVVCSAVGRQGMGACLVSWGRPALVSFNALISK